MIEIPVMIGLLPILIIGIGDITGMYQLHYGIIVIMTILLLNELDD